MTRMGNERGAWKLLVGKPEGKRPVGRPRMRWENNINHDLSEVDYTGDDWKTLAEDRKGMEGLCPCSHEPMGSIVPVS